MDSPFSSDAAPESVAWFASGDCVELKIPPDEHDGANDVRTQLPDGERMSCPSQR
jgi:hypothetical protein